MVFVLDIILTTNSPGEVSAWVKPVVKKLNELNIDKEIYVFTPPCVFSSNNEDRVLSELDGITASFDSREYLKYILLNIKPDNFNPFKQGFVLFLGGDFMHAVFLGKKLNYPVYSYTERDFGFKNSVRKFYLSDKTMYDKLKNKGVDTEKLKTVGNLMYDSVDPQLSKEEAGKILNKAENEILINLLPGSRPKEFDFALPLFLNCAVELSKKNNNYKFIVSKAPFIEDKDIIKTLNDDRIKGKTKYSLKDKIINVQGLEIKVHDRYLQSIMRDSDFALTIPGTNNLELALLNTPMLVVLPLNKPKLIPLPGLIGLIGEIPVLGKFLKRKIVPKMAAKREYISLINLIENREIVPELKGNIDSKILAKEVFQLIENNELKDIKERFNQLFIEKGAADKIIGDIIQDLEKNFYQIYEGQ